MKWFRILLPLSLLAACAPAAPLPSPRTVLPAAPAATRTLPRPTSTPSPLPTLAPSATATTTMTVSPSPAASATPEYQKLRVLITIANAVCHYGPGKPYLYKYGVHEGYNMEAISRDPTGTYIEVQAIRGDNPCWVNADYMEIKGDPALLKPVLPEEVRLPMSPYYAPPPGVKAERQGDDVTVTWAPLILKAGDSSEQTPYIVEAWVCQAGLLTFLPVGSYQNRVVIKDEAGCGQPSRARFLAAEKHGYTRPVEIDWPPVGN